MEFLGDVAVYRDRVALASKPVDHASSKEVTSSVSSSPNTGSTRLAVEPVLKVNSATASALTSITTSDEPILGVWLGKSQGKIPEIVDKMLSAIGLQRNNCLFWADHDQHPVQLCQNQPHLRKVLVLAPAALFPKLKPDQPLFHEGITFLRSWDSETLDLDTVAKRMLWNLMKVHFQTKK